MRNLWGVVPVQRKDTKLRLALIEKLKESGIKVGPRGWIERLRPGHWQRSAGAWVWVLNDPDRLQYPQPGSQYTMKECAKAHHLELGSNGDIDPMDDPKATPKRANP